MMDWTQPLGERDWDLWYSVQARVKANQGVTFLAPDSDLLVALCGICAAVLPSQGPYSEPPAEHVEFHYRIEIGERP